MLLIILGVVFAWLIITGKFPPSSSTMSPASGPTIPIEKAPGGATSVGGPGAPIVGILPGIINAIASALGGGK